MQQDITLYNNTLIFYRKIWHPDDIFLAQCLWFAEDIEASTFTADLTVTLPTAVKAFLEQAFPAFMCQPLHAEAKEQLSKDIAKIYKQIRADYIKNVVPLIPYWGLLRKHQKTADIQMFHRRVNLLGAQMRTGKSIMALTHSLATKRKRTVILCYNIGKQNWVNDMTRKFWNKEKEVFDPFDFTVLDASKRKIAYAWRERYVIVNYESAAKYMKYLIEGGGTKTDHIIFDEVQRVKNSNSGLGKMAQELMDALPEARVTMMSGTYIMNRPDDVFSYLRLAKHPLGKSKADFDRRYLVQQTDGRHTKTVGAKDANKLAAHMSNFAIRILFSDCSDMPPKQHVQLFYGIGEWRELYNEAVRKAIEDHGKNVSNSWIHSVNNVMAQAKVPGTMEHILQIVDEGNKVVLFTSYEEPLSMLEKALKEEKVKYVRVDGKVLDASEKMRRATQFQEDDDTMVFIGNLTAAGHTIPLHKANIIIMLNQPLTPKAMEQGVARVEHMDKKDTVTVYYPTCVGEKGEITVDEKLVELNAGKLLDIDAVVDGGKDINNIENMSEVLFESLLQQYGKKEKV